MKAHQVAKLAKLARKCLLPTQSYLTANNIISSPTKTNPIGFHAYQIYEKSIAITEQQRQDEVYNLENCYHHQIYV